MTSYDGVAITYDEIGNPLTYYNGWSYSFTWRGRQLVGATKDSKNITFVYNDDGIRTGKTVNGVEHSYYLAGDLIMAEAWEDKLLVYLYDASSSPIGMMYRTTSYAEDVWDIYWYEKNLQGDIVAVYNSSGTKVATYTYENAWGDHLVSYTSTTAAQYNPFRYRGYYYDTDLGMYYLQSRYYDPATARFINSDGHVSTGQGLTGNNMFAYCGNNPVMNVDPSGEAWYNDLYDLANTALGLLNPLSKLTFYGAIFTAMLKGNWSGLAHDIASGALNPLNMDEQVALESEVVAFYKGETVVRHSIEKQSSAQIFGTIFLNRDEKYDDEGKGIKTINHEWGHGVQERLLGVAYLPLIAAPSVHYCYFGDYRNISDKDLKNKMYYSKVWERTADWLGGVDRNNYFDFWYSENFIPW